MHLLCCWPCCCLLLLPPPPPPLPSPPPLCMILTIYGTCNDIFNVKYVLYLYISTSSSLCAVHCTIWLFFCSSVLFAFPVCCSGTVWVILRWCKLPFCYRYHFFIYFPRALYCYCMVLYFTFFSALFLITLLCLLKLQHLLTYMFLFHYHGLWCLVCW